MFVVYVLLIKKLRMKKIIIILSSIILSCGSDKKSYSKIPEINVESLAKVNRLPNTDPKADLSHTNDFKEAFEDYQDQFKFTSLLLTSRRWVVKNNRDGKPISRERIAAITAELDGSCYIQHYIFKQDADGSSFDDTYISESYGWKSFDCKLLD